MTIECKTESNKGEIIGGKPGTDLVTVTFDDCSVAGKTVAECAATSINPAPKGGMAGEIELTVKTVLVFDGWTGQRTKADDAFFPEGTKAEPNLFVEFELKGTNCGVLNLTKVKVLATGTEVKEVGGKAFGPRKCGVLAEVGEIEAGAAETFKRTASGATVIKGGLNFPGTLTKAELEEKATGYREIECKLTSAGAAAEETGTALVETEPAEAFGWEA